MKYTYAFKTSDGARHEAAMEAASREAVFTALRERGIKAIKVVAADGSKANGEVRGVRKRAVAALVAVVALLAGAAAFLVGERTRTAQGGADGDPAARSPRHQIYGDPALVEAFKRGRFEDALERPGDRRLAWFSQPGRLLCPKGMTSAQVRRLSDEAVAELQAVGESDIATDPSEPREVRELKQIVNGIRAEMREYLANGNGTIRSFWRRLLERTRQEAQIYERTRRELENEKSHAVWERKNDALRRLGLRTIPNPQDDE